MTDEEAQNKPDVAAAEPKKRGRVKGSRNKTKWEMSRDLAMKIAGVLPKEALLEGMAFYITRVRKLQMTNGDERMIADAYEKMKWFAKEAAVYCHPKLGSVEHTGKDGGPIKVETNARERLAHLLAGQVAAGAATGDPKSIN